MVTVGTKRQHAAACGNDANALFLNMLNCSIEGGG